MQFGHTVLRKRHCQLTELGALATNLVEIGFWEISFLIHCPYLNLQNLKSFAMACNRRHFRCETRISNYNVQLLQTFESIQKSLKCLQLVLSSSLCISLPNQQCLCKGYREARNLRKASVLGSSPGALRLVSKDR